MKILVTGANGFVGTALCKRILANDFYVHAATRTATSAIPSSEFLQRFVVGEIDQGTNWMPALMGVDTVIHLAARVHMMQDHAVDPLREFLKVNLDATVHLARQAAAAGVKRFVYLSSIKVNGESTSIDKPFRETDTPNPQDPYAVSKMRAEEALQHIANETGMEVVVVRPPLIYGPGVKANFHKLLDMVNRGVPLPLGCVKNKRSFIYIGNLCDALLQIAGNPLAAGHTYLVSDGEAVSTAELVESISRALHRSPRLVSVPVGIMRFSGKLVGKSAAIDRLTQSLVVDSSKITAELGWIPTFTLAQGLQDTVDWYRKSNPSKLTA